MGQVPELVTYRDITEVMERILARLNEMEHLLTVIAEKDPRLAEELARPWAGRVVGE